MIYLSFVVRQNSNHIWSIDFSRFSSVPSLSLPVCECAFSLQRKYKLSHFCRHGFFAWNLSPRRFGCCCWCCCCFIVFDPGILVGFLGEFLFSQMQLKWKNVDLYFCIYFRQMSIEAICRRRRCSSLLSLGMCVACSRCSRAVLGRKGHKWIG